VNAPKPRLTKVEEPYDSLHIPLEEHLLQESGYVDA
jgi:hypothetical protein